MPVETLITETKKLIASAQEKEALEKIIHFCRQDKKLAWFEKNASALLSGLHKLENHS